jgi:hypothetical protein
MPLAAHNPKVEEEGEREGIEIHCFLNMPLHCSPLVQKWPIFELQSFECPSKAEGKRNDTGSAKN